MWFKRVDALRYVMLLLVSFSLFVVFGCGGDDEPQQQVLDVGAARIRLGELVGEAEGGVVVGVREAGHTLMLEGFDGSETPVVSGTTVFEVGSVTKQFTAALVLKAVEDGLLSLDDNLRSILTDYPAGQAISLRQLLTHTAGIPNYTDIAEIQMGAYRPWSSEELVATFATLPLDFAPGTSWRYSNSGYFLLGLIVERVFEQPYAVLLRDKLFVPFGMHDSGYCDVDAHTVPRAPGHFQGMVVPSVDMSVVYAAGAVCSSAADLLRWSEALHGGRVVAADLHTSSELSNGTLTHYSYGLFVGTTGLRQTVGHAGDIPGTSTRLVRYQRTPSSPAFDLVVISNRGEADLVVLQDRIAQALLGETEGVAAPLSAASAARFVGDYVSELGPTEPPITIDFDDTQQRLTLQLPGQPAAPLTRRGDGHFAEEDSAVYLDFDTGAGPNKLRLEYGGVVIPFSPQQ